MPTLLEMHGAVPPSTVQGHSLVPLLEEDTALRGAAIFGRFGAATNVTDGRFTYFRYPRDMQAHPLYEYTLMPAHPRSPFLEEEFEGAELVRRFSFQRGYPDLKLPARRTRNAEQGSAIEETDTVLYDLHSDPGQERPVDEPEVEARLVSRMRDLMVANEAPPEEFARLDLQPPAA